MTGPVITKKIFLFSAAVLFFMTISALAMPQISYKRNDLKNNKAEINYLILKSTMLEAEYLDILSQYDEEFRKENGFINESNPVFVERTHSFGFVSKSGE